MSNSLLPTKQITDTRTQIKTLFKAIYLCATKYAKGFRIYKNSFSGNNKKTRGLKFSNDKHCVIHFEYNATVNGSLFVNAFLWSVIDVCEGSHMMRDTAHKKYVSTVVYKAITSHVKSGELSSYYASFMHKVYNTINTMLQTPDEAFARYITNIIELFLQWASANKQPYVTPRIAGGYDYELNSSAPAMKYMYSLVESVLCQYSHKLNPDIVWQDRYNVVSKIFNDPEEKEVKPFTKLSDLRAPAADINRFKSPFSRPKAIISEDNRRYSAEPMQRMMQAIDDNGFYLNKEELTEVIEKLQKLKNKL